MSSIFIYPPTNGQSGGGGTGNVTVVDNLTSTSSTDALSAFQGNVLNKKIFDHESKKASESELGHIKVDGVTATVETDGTLKILVAELNPDDVVDILTSTDVTKALSANAGRVLNEKIEAHINNTDIHLSLEQKTKLDGIADGANNYTLPVATLQTLGGVIPDGKTVDIDANGILSVIGGNQDVASLDFEQAILPTTAIGQSTWSLPFVFDMQNDLLIVVYNTTVLDTSGYTLSQNGGTVSVTVSPNYLNESIANNNLFVIAIRGGASGSNNQVAFEVFEQCLTSNSIGQSEWKIPLSSFDPSTDVLFVNYNTTVLTKQGYSLLGTAGDYSIKIPDIPSDLPINKNSICITIFQKTIGSGVTSISGNILVDDTVPESKLTQELKDKINLKVITFEERVNISVGDKNAQRVLPFDCIVDSFDISLLKQSTSPLSFNIKVSEDLKVWNNLFTSDITVPADTNIYTKAIVTGESITKGKAVRLSIISTTGDAESLSINMNVKTI